MRRAVLGSGNISPERLAAERLRSLFTFVAAQEVLDQLRGSGRGDLGSHDPIGYADLESHMVQQKLSEKNSEEWLHALAETNSRIAARVMEVRIRARRIPTKGGTPASTRRTRLTYVAAAPVTPRCAPRTAPRTGAPRRSSSGRIAGSSRASC